jgi:lipopolysaccharide transport system permease protein
MKKKRELFRRIPSLVGEELVIKPSRGFIPINLRDFIVYRELFYFFAWKEIKARYKQTVLGFAWAFLKPFISIVILTVVFGKIVKVPSENIPYPLFCLSGLVLWNYFSYSLLNSSACLIANQSLIKKVYFPRIIFPCSYSLSGIYDYLISLFFLACIMIYYSYPPSIYILLLPVVLVTATLTSIGLGLWLSAMSVKYRDIQYLVPFFIQLLMFITPVIYPPSIVTGKYRLLIYLNPMSGVIDAHRACILGNKAIDLELLGISLAVSLVIFISGLYYFKRMERYFADII